MTLLCKQWCHVSSGWSLKIQGKNFFIIGDPHPVFLKPWTKWSICGAYVFPRVIKHSYGLWNVFFFLGKTCTTGPLSIATLNYHRVSYLGLLAHFLAQLSDSYYVKALPATFWEPHRMNQSWSSLAWSSAGKLEKWTNRAMGQCRFDPKRAFA